MPPAVLLREADHKRGLVESPAERLVDAAIGPHLSSRDFAETEATMLLALLAFNMTTTLRNEFEAPRGGR